MKDRRFKRVFICLLAVLVLAFSSLSVFAKEFTDQEGQALVDSAQVYITSLYTYDDTELEQMKDLGDFYLVTSNMVQDEREELGAFLGVKDGGYWDKQSDGKILVHVPVQYEKYAAEIIITFDETGTQPLNFVINPEYSLGEKMFGAFQNFVLGILIVFIILLFLAFIISLLKFVNPDYRKKKAEEKAKRSGEAPKTGSYDNIPKAPLGNTAAAAAGPAPAAADDSELIAVIAAAIAAAESENGGSYVVRSIRRVGKARNWTRS